jgi:SAM-dependent methyltransferase
MNPLGYGDESMKSLSETVAYRSLKLLSHPRNRLTEDQISTKAAQRAYQPDTPRWFLELIGEYVDRRDKTVLDIGCGYGDLCIMLAKTGAKKAIGVDVDQVRIDYARRRAREEGVQGFLEFECADFVKDYAPVECSDLVLSLDAFEHILDPLDCLRKAYKCLKKSGTLATLFGPLWWSPYGAHMWGFTPVPWVHFLFPERVVLRVRAECYRPNQIVERYEDIVGHLNRMTVGRFERYAVEAGFKIRMLRVNPDKDRTRLGILRPINSVINATPILRELGSQLLLAILDKP